MVSEIWQWLNARWPFSSFLHLALDEEIPGGSRFAYTFGSTILTVFGLQAATGIMQLFFFVPTVDHAYNSINFLRTQVPFGWLISGLHHWGGSAMVVLVALHLTRIFIWGAYKRPRELTWLLGVLLLTLVMAMSFTGGPLSWDQKAYWEAEVGTSIPGSIPIVGDTMQKIMRGGAQMGQLTLSRFFIVHVAILPSALLLLIGMHLVAFRRFGAVGPWRKWDPARGIVKGHFWPDQVVKDLITGTLVILILITLAVFAPKPFYGAADPLDSTFIPKPEWNFLFLYQALKFFHGKLEPIASVGIPQLLLFLLIAVPFIDRRAVRNPVKRPIAMASGGIFAAIIITLTIMGYLSGPEGGAAPPAQSQSAAEEKGIEKQSADRSIEEATKGERLFRSEGCISCHKVNGEGGTIGPDLSNEGAKGRGREWLTTQIRNPKTHFPDSIMPAYTSLSDAEVNAIATYLLSLGHDRKPAVTDKERQVSTKEPVEPGKLTERQVNSGSPSKSGNQEQQTERNRGVSEKRPERAAFIIGNADRGKLVFNQECISCHGPEGTDKVPNPGSAESNVPPLSPVENTMLSKDPERFAMNIDVYIQHGSVPEGPDPRLHMAAFGDNNTLTQQQIANVEAYIMKLNGVDRARLINPGIKPERFFFIIIPVFLVMLLILNGVYRCLPK